MLPLQEKTEADTNRGKGELLGQEARRPAEGALQDPGAQVCTRPARGRRVLQGMAQKQRLRNGDDGTLTP